jgi:ribosomal protein S12 methylthiotransferase accessory factor
VEVIPGEGALILSEEAARALHGGAYEKIAPLIDGGRSRDEIVDALAGQVDAATVYYVLNGMEAKGYLTDAIPGIPASVAAFWHGAGIEPAARWPRCRDRGGRFDHRRGGFAAMLVALEAMGVKLRTQEQADLRLVLTDDYLRADLGADNAAAALEGEIARGCWFE